MKINNPFCTLTRFEWSLWITSLTVVMDLSRNVQSKVYPKSNISVKVP